MLRTLFACLITQLVTILFVVLKLTKSISWGWVWVMSPLWVPIACLAFSLTIAGIVFLLRR
jgi:hypothetical protein